VKRIVSLVPSITELVDWLGAGSRLVGRTKFCTEPPELAQLVPAFGGTKDPDVTGIVAVQPDLVIANKEENRREDVEALRAAGVRVAVTDPDSVGEAAAMVEEVGLLIGAQAEAARLATEIRAEIRPVDDPVGVFVATWWRPLMAMGGATFGNDVVRCAGGRNVFESLVRYPEVSLEAVAAARPDIILLPDEPFLFAERHVPPFSAIAPTRIIDGKLVWWYGPRLPQSIRTLRALLKGQAR
jgi:ABC-type hemin transport system substrate-binding protein